MKLLKPDWVSHNGNTILSVDIHPDGSRFATGGSGDDSGRIVIWNMSPVQNEEDEGNAKIPRILCQMDNHLIGVNCVRWSHSGKYLASGGMDKVVMIWQIGKYGTGSSFGSGVVNVEPWRCVYTLNGHDGDVLDLSWSPNDLWLASCAVDNSVQIWNALNFPERITVLRGHSGMVKGVTWDPVGKYVASQSDDKTLRIWRTCDWQQETKVTDPFKDCGGGSTQVLRLNWSPDGQYIVSAHALNNSGPTAQIVERDGWRTGMDLVGHRKAVTCVRFCPSIFKKFSKNGKMQLFTCFALGSRDTSLSIWLTVLKRPLVVLHDVFSSTILDLSWSITGTQLIVCSWDGTVAYVEFEEHEIGKSLTPEEKNENNQKMYGKSIAMMGNGTGIMATVIENPELLELREKKKEEDDKRIKEEKERELLVSQSSQSSKSSLTRIAGPTDKQIETRTPDGKRRITPMFIPLSSEGSDSPQPFRSESSKMSHSKIVVEKRDDVVQPNVSPPKRPPTSLSQDELSKGKIEKDASTNSKEETKDQSAVKEDVSKKEPEENHQKEEPSKAAESSNSCSKPANDVKAKPTVNMIPVKRKPDVEAAQPTAAVVKRPRGRPPGSLNKHRRVVASSPPRLVSSSPERDEQEERVTAQPRRTVVPAARPKIQLDVMDSRFSVQVRIKGTGWTYQSATVSVVNSAHMVSGGGTLHKLSCQEQGGVLWEALLSSPAVGVSANEYFSCVACEDATLNVFSTQNGWRIFPPLVIGSPASKLVIHQWYLMALSTRGRVWVWDVKLKKVVVKGESIAPLLENGEKKTVRSCFVSDKGIPIVTLNTGMGYSYDNNMAAWLCLHSPDESLNQVVYFSGVQGLNTSGSHLPLTTLQLMNSRRIGGSYRSYRGDPGVQQVGTVTYLDAQLAACKSLESAKEYKFHMLNLVRYLANEGLERRLREILDDLLGPVIVPPTSNNWESHIMGLSKRQLLKESLSIIATNLQLQRLYSEYNQQLKEAEEQR